MARLRVLFLCFFVSGALGLIYEVVWLRMLGLVFGHTVYAITAVLAAFMAGLALGSFLVGRRAGRIRNLIRAYGLFEIGIGLYCALIPGLLKLAASLYLAFQRVFGFSYDAFSAVQFLLVFAFLLVPTTLMGGTLPILSQALGKREAGLGRMIGALYAVNTFGAVAGVALAGYVLLPTWGNRATTLIAVIGNLAVGTLAMIYGGIQRPLDLSASPASASPTAVDEATSGASAGGEVPNGLGAGASLTLVALGVSGAVSMIYELTWTRALSLVIGSSTYAFTAMLVAFLVGIAGGSALYSWLWGTRPTSPAVFAALQAAIGISILTILLIFERMPQLLLLAMQWSDSPTFVRLIQLVVSSSSLLLPCMVIGATFPSAVAIAARGTARIGQDVGQVYAVNTLGAIAGTVLAGFALIPAIGVHASIKVGIAVNLLLAAVLFAVPPRLAGAWPWGGLSALLMAAGVFLVPPWDQRVMSSGPAVYAKAYLARMGSAGLAEVLRGKAEVIFFRDGRSGTVSVLREAGHLFLRVNGKADASTSSDMPTQVMAGHLPLLVHRDPKTVLVIGLGSGITAGAVARHAVERLDVVEIEPAVVEASRFFAEEHRDVLKDPRVHTVIADGRNFLLATPNRYDVIISEPSNPWIGGLASLFSVEFFQLAQQHLERGGMMVQWLQGYNLFPDDLRMVIKTFRAAFPVTSIWSTTRGDFLLLGRTEAAPLDLKLIERRYPAIRPDLLRLGIQAWPSVLGYFMLGDEDTRRFAEGAGLNTDDRLPLEFSAPRALYFNTTSRNWGFLRSFKTTELPDVTADSKAALEQADARYWIGAGYLDRQALEDALLHFQRALQLDPAHTRSLLGTSWVYLNLRQPSEALDFAKRAMAREPFNANALFLAGLASRALNSTTEATAFFERAVTLQPQNAEFRQMLAHPAEGAAPAPQRSGRVTEPPQWWLMPRSVPQ